MVFEYNATTGVKAIVQTRTGEQEFTCSLTVCPSPTCTCQTLAITLIPLVQTPEKEPASFEFDFKLNGLSKTFKKTASKESLKFAKTVIFQMKEPDFVLLANLFFSIKNDQTETTATDTSYFPFNYSDVEYESFCYGYKSVFPFAMEFSFNIEDKSFFITDQYCIQDGCDCAKVSLDIVEIVPDKKEKRAKDICYIDLDYKKRRWRMENQIHPDPSIKEIRVALEKEIPDLYEQVLKRHQKLKRIYLYNKKREWEAIPPHEVLIKTRRNDPCPCGSGKKYKKCCL